jgi:hypothetical protein
MTDWAAIWPESIDPETGEDATPVYETMPERIIREVREDDRARRIEEGAAE